MSAVSVRCHRYPEYCRIVTMPTDTKNLEMVLPTVLRGRMNLSKYVKSDRFCAAPRTITNQQWHKRLGLYRLRISAIS
jgi:hypothetical protein